MDITTDNINQQLLKGYRGIRLVATGVKLILPKHAILALGVGRGEHNGGIFILHASISTNAACSTHMISNGQDCWATTTKPPSVPISIAPFSPKLVPSSNRRCMPDQSANARVNSSFL